MVKESKASKASIQGSYREFKVREEVKGHLRIVLGRRGIPCHFKERDGQWYCRVRISGDRFHKALMRAICEKKTEETGLFYLTYAESRDLLLRESLMRTFKVNHFIVLDTRNH